jgi:glycosyltransferase involved in cell wall biosynthesis
MWMIDLSVVTATRGRPEWLASCLEQFRRQKVEGLRCEQIVVSDGPDPHAKFLARRFGVRFVELASPGGKWGAFAKDEGIRAAEGRYVCFWDDDNLYFDTAMASLWAAVQGHDIGVVRTWYRLRSRPGCVAIPRRWDGRFRLGDIDTMCVCVRRELALWERWSEASRSNGRGTDFDWLLRLSRRDVRIRHVRDIIGWHL